MGILEQTNRANCTSIVVGVADMQVSNRRDTLLVTHALGSCIAVLAYSPTLRVGGMLHYMLPLASSSPDKAALRPAMFADTGIPLLFDELFKLGCKRSDLVIKAVGGAAMYDDHGKFNIGKRNHTVLRKIFWKNNIMLAAEDVGGHKSRTVRMYIEDGHTVVSSMGKETIL
ncbi:MAG: chemotaxis protein CheD [Lentisphaeria bacterium]|jgi:chemotaxis protein CheD|nr:chemotaxis protein CheD [Lentisphaeria bacterium]